MDPDPPELLLLRDSFPDRPAFGTAVSATILERVAAGTQPATLRVHRPGRELALSKQDAISPGFAAAVAAGRAAGFEPVLRLAGGRAAAFHEGTLAFALAVPERDPARTVRDRFGRVARAIEAALRSLGIDARVGEVPDEYCPGEWSVNARGSAKLVGIGQRLVAGGAHVGGVIVVSDGERLRELLVAVYAALGLELDPATVGSLEDEIGPIGLDLVADAVISELSAGSRLVPSRLDGEILERAAALESERMAA